MGKTERSRAKLPHLPCRHGQREFHDADQAKRKPSDQPQICGSPYYLQHRVRRRGGGRRRTLSRLLRLKRDRGRLALLAALDLVAELLALAQIAVSVSRDMNWQDGDHVRLVFHAFKPFRNVEAEAVKSLMNTLG
jgi:hypothetical protein